MFLTVFTIHAFSLAATAPVARLIMARKQAANGTKSYSPWLPKSWARFIFSPNGT
jgi:hypothetical protein